MLLTNRLKGYTKDELYALAERYGEVGSEEGRYQL
ncbi:hypothetical protein CIY_26740 [Butyrivibrio fibrisolvens 16/4]|nr:hypothetical protein CIY_26740 [Butyrivibrio fibrisolvens 16/4]